MYNYLFIAAVAKSLLRNINMQIQYLYGTKCCPIRVQASHMSTYIWDVPYEYWAYQCTHMGQNKIIHAFNFMVGTFGYFTSRSWDKDYCTQNELVVLMMCKFCQGLTKENANKTDRKLK